MPNDDLQSGYNHDQDFPLEFLNGGKGTPSYRHKPSLTNLKVKMEN